MTTRTLPDGRELLMKDDGGAPALVTLQPCPDDREIPASVTLMFVETRTVDELRADMLTVIDQTVPAAYADEARAEVESTLAEMEDGGALMGRPVPLADATVGSGVVLTMTLGMN